MFGFLKKKKQDVSEPTLETQVNTSLLDLLSPDSIEEKADYIRLGGNYCRDALRELFCK